MRGRSERTSTRATSMAWRTPFPPSRMPASIELSIKLVVCLSGQCLDNLWMRGMGVRFFQGHYACQMLSL